MDEETLARITKILTLLEEKTQAAPWSREQIREELQRADNLTFLIHMRNKSDGRTETVALVEAGELKNPENRDRLEETVGYCLARLLPETEAEILRLGVPPEIRRRGLGRRLLAAALEEIPGKLRAKNERKIFLEVAENNVPALALYESMGFRRVGRRKNYYAGEIDALILAREI